MITLFGILCSTQFSLWLSFFLFFLYHDVIFNDRSFSYVHGWVTPRLHLKFLFDSSILNLDPLLSFVYTVLIYHHHHQTSSDLSVKESLTVLIVGNIHRRKIPNRLSTCIVLWLNRTSWSSTRLKSQVEKQLKQISFRSQNWCYQEYYYNLTIG